MKNYLMFKLFLIILFFSICFFPMNSNAQQPIKKNDAIVIPPKILLKKGNIEFIGGTGNTLLDAIIIKGTKSEKSGMEAEIFYLEKLYGKKNIDWRILRQRVLEKDKRTYDFFIIETKEPKKTINIFFDITEFFAGW